MSGGVPPSSSLIGSMGPGTSSPVVVFLCPSLTALTGAVGRRKQRRQSPEMARCEQTPNQVVGFSLRPHRG